MKRFDCLSLDLPLFGPHLLEASAGTGKTFSIEHIFVRLILESVEIEEILVVTFTRAATRELRGRIRENLEQAASNLREKKASWEYLAPHIDSEKALRKLSYAVANFDRAQIFTIHSFCYRVLKEFSFQAKVGSIHSPDEKKVVPESLKRAAIDFLDYAIGGSLLSLEQISLLFQEFTSKEALVDALLQLKEPQEVWSFSEVLKLCKAALQDWQGPKLEEEKLVEDFRAIEGNYKKMKGNFLPQVRALVNLEVSLPILLKERGTLFDFLSWENLKKRMKEPSLHYPGFFDWAQERLSPYLKQEVFPILQKTFFPVAQTILAKEDFVRPDEILLRMQEACLRPSFRKLVQDKYQAAVVDEFQDTDAVQWNIFESLFLNPPIRALYLVGDPKQSIYRFRKADVYTYLAAKNQLGEEALYHLDTNFRSSKPLIEALNCIFSRDWMDLPKVNQKLSYHPVRAGAQIEGEFKDDKRSVHFFVSEKEHAEMFDEVSLPFVVREIETLQPKSCAILVRDRYQAEKALNYLKKRNIPAAAKSYEPLGKTPAFQAICELFEATFSPRDPNLIKIVLEGPFGKPDLCFVELRHILLERGLVAFSKEFQLDDDAMQVFELLFASLGSHGFSMAELRSTLRKIRSLHADEGGRKRMLVNSEAVQIMTMQISKGLEFDVVFALGLATRTPESEDKEELNAEKKRQLYVAMTRAKKRLYVPFPISKKTPLKGTESPIELFSLHFEGSMIDALRVIPEVSVEFVQEPLELPPPKKREEAKKAEKSLKVRSYVPCFLSSFSSLAKPHVPVLPIEKMSDAVTLQTMPRGKETGILIHSLFEEIFKSKGRARDLEAIEGTVHRILAYSFLEPWSQVLHAMVREVLTMELKPGFCLQDLESQEVLAELEFVYPTEKDFIKGYIDLVFCYQNRVYFIDWKTNWLEQYQKDDLKAAMKAHDYGLQFRLYREAIQRHFPYEFGGAFYVFVRGEASFLYFEKIEDMD